MADAYAIKHARATARPSPKILLLGGSSTLFSLDSRLLERAWERPVINFGANVALGLRYLLDSVKPHLRPGDLILAPLEYNLYQDQGVPSDQLLDYLVGQDPDYWRRLDLLARLEVVARLPASRLLAGLAARGRPPLAYRGHYAAKYIDNDGNYRANALIQHDADTQAAIRAAARQATAKIHHYGRDHQPDSPGWRRLQDYQRRLHERDICLILLPPAMMNQSRYREDPREIAYYRQLPARARTRGLIYLGEPLAFMYPPEDFFDTLYHLNAGARARHTQAVLGLIGADPWQHCAAD
jgi:hypothetical protein